MRVVIRGGYRDMQSISLLHAMDAMERLDWIFSHSKVSTEKRDEILLLCNEMKGISNLVLTNNMSFEDKLRYIRECDDMNIEHKDNSNSNLTLIIDNIVSSVNESIQNQKEIMKFLCGSSRRNKWMHDKLYKLLLQMADNKVADPFEIALSVVIAPTIRVNTDLENIAISICRYFSIFKELSNYEVMKQFSELFIHTYQHKQQQQQQRQYKKLEDQERVVMVFLGALYYIIREGTAQSTNWHELLEVLVPVEDMKQLNAPTQDKSRINQVQTLLLNVLQCMHSFVGSRDAIDKYIRATMIDHDDSDYYNRAQNIVKSISICSDKETRKDLISKMLIQRSLLTQVTSYICLFGLDVYPYS